MGSWAVGSGQWQWAVGSGQWAVGSGQWQWAMGRVAAGLVWFGAIYMVWFIFIFICF